MKRPITIISSISSLLFLTAIIWFGAGIYLDKKSGNEKVETRYESLLYDTKEALSKNPYGTSEFSNQFIRAIGNIDDFSSLKLEINGELVYSYPPGLFSLPSPDLVKHFERDAVVSPDCTITLSAALYLMKPNSIYNYAKIAFLLILVGTVIAIVLIILTSGTDDSIIKTGEYRFKKRNFSDDDEVYRPFSTESEKSSKFSDKSDEKAEKLESGSKSTIKSETPQESKPKTETTPKIEPEPAKSASETETKIEEKPIFNPDLIPTMPEPTKTEQISEPAHETAPIAGTPQKSTETINKTETTENLGTLSWDSDSNDSEADDDAGLDIIDQFEQGNAESDFDFPFEDDEKSENSIESSEIESEPLPVFAAPAPSSNQNQIEETEPAPQAHISPVTNLNVQSSLEGSLENAIKSNQKTTVSLLKVNGLDRGNAISQKIIEILKNSASRASEGAQIFEYNADSYAVIGSKDLQETVDDFEEIYNKITDFLKDNNSANEVSIGISSASGRKVTAERVLLESSQALDYASQDPDSPIVAFRANPEKYQEFIENQ